MTGVGAVVNAARVSAGESVAIFGLGGVGLAALLGAHASGANPLVAVDLAAHKFELARSLGATHCIDAADPNAIERLRELSHGGVQFAIESVGDERVLAQAYAATRRGGTTVTVGLPPLDRMLSVPAFNLVVEERTIKGSFMGSSVPARDIPRFIALYRAGLLPVDRLLTHRLQMDEINGGFDRLARAEAIRQVVLL
jgi:alcohol dehydrogenase